MTAPSSSELRFVKTTFSNTAAENGGPMLATVNPLIANAAMNNVFDHVLSDQRTSGLTTRRKLGLKIHQDDTAGYLASARFGVEPTLGEDVVRMFSAAAGADEYEDDLTGSERKYCGGVLVNAITAGASSLVVDVKLAACTGDIDDGDIICLTDKYTPDGTGNTEYLTVSGAPSVSGTQLTITVAETIANSYAAYSAGTGGKVCSVLAHGTIQAAYSSFSQSRASGYDDSTYPVILNNMGAIDDEITLTFADATNFTVESARLGTLASGSKGSDYSPLHPVFAKALFTLESVGWNGAVTHQAGDTLTFSIAAAVAYLWEERIIPAGCAPLSGNRVILLHTSEGL